MQYFFGYLCGLIISLVIFTFSIKYTNKQDKKEILLDDSEKELIATMSLIWPVSLTLFIILMFLTFVFKKIIKQLELIIEAFL
jgi:hypothetical protein